MRVESNADKLAVQWKNEDNLMNKKHLHIKVRETKQAEWEVEVIQEKDRGLFCKYFCSYSRMRVTWL